MVNVCIRNTNVIIWLGHGCSGSGMHSENERYYGMGMDALVFGCTRMTNVIMVWAWIVWLSDALGTRTLSCFGHGCSGYCTHSEHERYYGLGLYALVILPHSNIEKRDAWYTQYIFGALETLRMRGPWGHAGHIPRGRPNMQIRSDGANNSSNNNNNNNDDDDDDDNKTKYLPLHPRSA